MSGTVSTITPRCPVHGARDALGDQFVERLAGRGGPIARRSFEHLRPEGDDWTVEVDERGGLTRRLGERYARRKAAGQLCAARRLRRLCAANRRPAER
jgi:hypothetical protein